MGKENSSEHHYRTYILCIVNHGMPWYSLSWVLGSDIYLYQEKLYRSEFCNRKLGRILKKKKKKKQRTNGPVNAHLRSAVYTDVIENSPSIGADEALGPLFFQNNQYTVHTSFSLQMTF